MRLEIGLAVLLSIGAVAAGETTSASAAKDGDATAASGWAFDPHWTLSLKREDSGETRLNGREIWYKDRGPARFRAQVILEREKEVATAVQLKVPLLWRESEFHGRKEILQFDPNIFDRRINGRREWALRSDASEADRKALHLVVKQPWYRLDCDGKAWSTLTSVAMGHAWPLADQLNLHREIALLLPPLEWSALRKGYTKKQTILLPYPVPLSPAPTTEVDYQVTDLSNENGRPVASVAMASTMDVRPADGVEWGGIKLSVARVHARVAGRFLVDITSRRLREAAVEIEVDMETAGGEDAFESNWKMKSHWQQEDRD